MLAAAETMLLVVLPIAPFPPPVENTNVPAVMTSLPAVAVIVPVPAAVRVAVPATLRFEPTTILPAVAPSVLIARFEAAIVPEVVIVTDFAASFKVNVPPVTVEVPTLTAEAESLIVTPSPEFTDIVLALVVKPEAAKVDKFDAPKVRFVTELNVVPKPLIVPAAPPALTVKVAIAVGRLLPSVISPVPGLSGRNAFVVESNNVPVAAGETAALKVIELPFTLTIVPPRMLPGSTLPPTSMVRFLVPSVRVSALALNKPPVTGLLSNARLNANLGVPVPATFNAAPTVILPVSAAVPI